MPYKSKGFTIVELLIVIVVIGILAAITVVAFTGVQNRANDTTVKSDIRGIAKQLELYKADNGVYPAGTTQMSTVKPRVSKTAYGNGIISNTYNILYCRVAAEGPTKFALVASSKSGNVFTYKSEDRQISQSSAWVDQSNSAIICQNAGINQSDGSDRDWLYLSGAWISYTN